MILPITVYGNPVLRKVAKEIKEDYKDLDKLIENMFETMYKAEGVGLAAPQVNKSIRLIVIDATPFAEDEPDLKDFKKVFINPEILEFKGEKELFNEGCLSLPGIREDVTRPTKIRIVYQDENFNEFEEVWEGVKARIVQHEHDHLQGKLFVDHISPIKKRLINSKLTAIAKGKTIPDYKIMRNK
ncbi:MAG: peptide deformylase [Salinivirgaceae bacterium]|jgi:peptide deformylase|nr:peptide deformylase [Salinivirgaceae bacterium]